MGIKVYLEDSHLDQGPLQEETWAIGAGKTRSLMATVTVMAIFSSLLEVSPTMPSCPVTPGPAD